MKLVMLNSLQFRESFEKIAKAKLPVKTSFKLKGITLKIQKELKKYEELRMELLNQLCKKNDQGELEVDEEGKAKFTDDVAQQEFGTKMVELGNVDVEVGTLSVSDLDAVELSLNDLFVLDGLVVE